MGRISFFLMMISRVGFVLLLVILQACAKKPSNMLPSEQGHSGSQVMERNQDPVAASEDYVLGSEDVLEVLVWRDEGLSRTVSIRPDGKISLPLIGDVPAAGFTPAQIRDSIIERLREYKETTEVSVIVKEINSLSVFVVGEVLRPGKLQLRSKTTLLQAITLSGGFTQYADPNEILVLRQEGEREKRMRISYKEIITGKNPAANIVLQRGDTIVVP